MKNRRFLLATTMLSGVISSGVASSFFSIAGSTIAEAADPSSSTPTQSGCLQAVDGVNGKVAGFGGSFANDSTYGGTGSIATPIGCGLGAQIDTTAASFDGRFLGNISGHLFWRDPTKGLLGLYGSYTYWDQVGGVRAGHIGPEGEWYAGRWTLEGVAGVEFGNTASAIVGPVIQTYDVATRFFDQVNVAYYLQDNLKVYAGQRYLGGKDALALGGEYGIPLGHGVMAGLFAEGRIGEDNFKGVWGGLRFYFGQQDKTLIRRHREDDPNNWEDGFGTVQNGGSTTPTPVQSENGPP